jgi:hypothetical protein
MEKSKLSFNLNTTDPVAKLGFEVWINEQCVFDTEHVAESLTITGNLPDDSIEKEHTLKLVLKNKQTHHTTVNEHGEIVKDVVLKISNIAFDGIELGHDILNLAQYRHDYNGNGNAIVEQFRNDIGCNGSVELKFSTPIYLWMLENM